MLILIIVTIPLERRERRMRKCVTCLCRWFLIARLCEGDLDDFLIDELFDVSDDRDAVDGWDAIVVLRRGGAGLQVGTVERIEHATGDEDAVPPSVGCLLS